MRPRRGRWLTRREKSWMHLQRYSTYAFNEVKNTLLTRSKREKGPPDHMTQIVTMTDPEVTVILNK